MPIHVDIRVNKQIVNQIHIARVKGGTGPKDLNEYMAVEGDLPTSLSDWYTDGHSFNHWYADGAEVCVIKALQALGYTGEQTTRS